MCCEWMPRIRGCAANFFFFKGVNRIRPACLVDGRGEWLLAVFLLVLVVAVVLLVLAEIRSDSNECVFRFLFVIWILWNYFAILIS